MHPYYSVMGLVAKISDPMSRFTIREVPSNVLVVVGCGVISYLTVGLGMSPPRHRMMATKVAPPAANYTTPLIIIAVCVIIGLLFLISILKMHVIFQPQPIPRDATGQPLDAPYPGASGIHGAPQTHPAASRKVQPPKMTITGKLHLNEKVRGRFMNAPAALLELESGETAIASNLDASDRVYGNVVKGKVGLWLAVPEKNSLTWREGLFYCGLRGKPALELRYRDQLAKSKKSMAVVAFNNDADREAFINSLSVNQ